MSIKRIIFSIHPMIRNTILIIPLLSVVLVYFLQQGITIDRLTIGHFQVKKLYLKLDKKLTLRIDRLSFPSNKTKTDTTTIETTLDRLKMLPRFFDYIYLDRVDLAHNKYRIIYHDDVIYLSSDQYEIAGSMVRHGDTITADIPFLHLKQYQLYLKGTLKYRYKNDKLGFGGTYDLSGIRGSIKALGDKNGLQIDLKSDKFTSIKPIIDMLQPDPETLEWVTKRIKSSSYQIKSASAYLKRRDDKYTIEPMKLRIEAKLDKPKVRFEYGLKPITAQTASILIEENVLYVSMTHPVYSERSLDGSTFFLTNIMGTKPSKIHINLQTTAPIDHKIAYLLKHYDIDLPIKQTKGSVGATVIMDISPKSGQTDIRGKLKIARGEMELYETHLSTFGGLVEFDDHGHITLKHLDTSTGWLHSIIDGTIDTPAQKATLSMYLKSMYIGPKSDPIISMHDKSKIPIHIHWHKQPQIDLPLYKTKITINNKGGYSVDISDIKPILKYVHNLPIDISSGGIKITSKDSKHYTFGGHVIWPSSYLYDNKGPIHSIPFSGSLAGSSFKLKALNNQISYSSSDATIYIKNIYIDGKKALALHKKGKSSSTTKLNIAGTNTLIRYDKYVLLTDRFRLRIRGNKTIFSATKDGDTVNVKLNGDHIEIHANRIKAPMLRALIHFGGLTKGRYSLDMHGQINGTMQGIITVEGGIASSFKTYNNMIALFNTVPALSTMSNPGFSSKGYEIRTGRIEFRIVKNRVFFDNILIDGKSAAISGKGTVSTLNGAIDIDLAVRTARGIGKLIGSIPLVGYILMGKDKSVTTGVKVSGTLDNPKVTTHVVMETLLAPFNMLVRTIKSPAHIINN